MARLEELKSELAATIQYGKQIGEKLQHPDLPEAERMDLSSELEAVEKKAEGISLDLRKEQKDAEREMRIKAIGRDMDVESVPDEQVMAPHYKDAVDAFFKSEQFASFRQDVRDGKRDAKVDPIEYKAAESIETAQVGDKDTSAFVPGITNLNYTFPLSVGSLFTQATMQGSNISYLKIPSGATGDAQYQTTLGSQKGGNFAATLDVANETAKTVAAVATIPSQNLDDVNGLEGEVRSLLLVGPNGLGEILEDAYINGGGGSSEIQGILDLSPADSTLSSDYVSKSVFKAMADINAQTGFTADAVVVHPDDWFVLSTEVGTEDNRPLFGQWGTTWGQNGVGPRIVVSRQIASGTILVGAFKAATRYVRQGVTISADASGLGLRDKNLVLFVAETREMVLHRYSDDPFRTVTVAS